MKRTILIALVLSLFTSTAVQAQNRASKRQNENRQEQTRADKDLNLNQAQSTQMKAINREYQQKANAIRTNKNLTKQQQNDQLNALRDETRTKRMAILTATQREKFDALEKKHGKGYAYGDWKDTGEKRGKRLGADNGEKKGWENGNGPYKDRAKDGAYNNRGLERYPATGKAKKSKGRNK